MPHLSSSEESLYDSSPIRGEVPNTRRNNSVDTRTTIRIDSGFGSSKGKSLDNISQIYDDSTRNNFETISRIDTVILTNEPKVDAASQQIKCLYTNAQSIREKFSDLRRRNLFESYDVIGISESWLNLNRDLLEDFVMEGYAVFNMDRSIRPGLDSFTQGGGVLVYVKKEYSPVRLNYPNPTNFYVESIWVQLTVGQQNLNVGIIYRPSKQDKGVGFHYNVGTLIHSQIREYCTTNSFVVLGNFNYPKIDWNNPTKVKEIEEAQFLSLLKELHLFQKVDKSTFKETIVDLIICKDENVVKNIKIEDGLLLSDYKTLTFTIEMKKTTTRTYEDDSCCCIL